jgi:hypothetical protein
MVLRLVLTVGLALVPPSRFNEFEVVCVVVEDDDGILILVTMVLPKIQAKTTNNSSRRKSTRREDFLLYYRREDALHCNKLCCTLLLEIATQANVPNSKSELPTGKLRRDEKRLS